jgi:type III secretory pathway component EscS
MITVLSNAHYFGIAILVISSVIIMAYSMYCAEHKAFNKWIFSMLIVAALMGGLIMVFTPTQTQIKELYGQYTGTAETGTGQPESKEPVKTNP